MRVSSLVVVGVDGSRWSDAAVVQAAREAAWRRARLHLVHVVPRPVSAVGVPSLDLAPLRRLTRQAAALAQEAAPGIEVSETVEAGATVPVLAREARGAGLVVTGSRGMGGFTGMLLGSTAESLSAHSECPVMVVRGDTEHAGPVVLGADGSRSGEWAVEFAFAEAALRGAGLVAVHAWSPEGKAPERRDEEAAERLLTRVVASRRERYPEVAVTREVVRGEPRQTLIGASAAAQLVVAGARGGGGFLRQLLGSVSKALLHHAHCPVAVVRNPRASG